MFASKHYRAQAAEYKERADRAITLKEKRKFQNLERSFATLAEKPIRVGVLLQQRAEAIRPTAAVAA